MDQHFLAGMLIRPLLKIRRAEILAYLKENNVPFCHDHTNEITEFTRNRIRNELIPQLERDYNPAIGEALLRLAEQSQWINIFLQESVDERFAGLLTAGSNRTGATGSSPASAGNTRNQPTCSPLADPGAPGPVAPHPQRNDSAKIVLDASALLREPKILQTELARRAIVELGAGEKNLTFDHLVSIVELARKNVSGKRLGLPGGVTVTYDRKKLTFARSTNDRSRSRRL